MPLILLLATFLRFFRLGHQSFWHDEIMTAGSYAPPTQDVSYWTKLLWDVHGPLYSFFMHFWSKAGDGETWLRLPGAAAGVISVYLIYRWISIRLDRGTAEAGALLMSISPFALYYSQELRFYSFLVMFVLLSLIVFERFMDDPSPRNSIYLGLTLGITFLAHFMALFLMAGMMVFLIVTGRMKGKYLRHGAAAAAIALLIVSPWIYRQLYFLNRIRVVDISELPESDKLRGESTLSIWSYPYILYAFSTGFSFGPDLRELHMIGSTRALLERYWYYLGPVFLFFGFAYARGLIRTWREKRLALLLSISLVTVVVTTVIAMKNIKVFNVRYQMCVFPVFLAFLAAGTGGGRKTRILLLIPLSLLMLAADWNYHINPKYARDDFRSAAGFVEENEIAGDIVLVAGFDLNFMHYYKGINEVVTLYPSAMTSDRVGEEISKLSATGNRIWYIRCRNWSVDPEDLILLFLSDNSKSLLVKEMPGIRVYLFERADH